MTSMRRNRTSAPEGTSAARCQRTPPRVLLASSREGDRWPCANARPPKQCRGRTLLSQSFYLNRSRIGVRPPRLVRQPISLPLYGAAGTRNGIPIEWGGGIFPIYKKEKD